LKRAALYLRVSSEEQTVENQRPELERLAASRGFAVVRTYEESASASKKRPAFDAMMNDAHLGHFNAILIWALDRLGRSMIGNLETILSLDRKNVTLISARESWLEIAGPARELLVGIISWVAETERDRLIERTRAGLERARAEGKHIGRPRVIDGIARQARFLLSKPGATYPAVARELGISESSLRRGLRKQAESASGLIEKGEAPLSKGGAPAVTRNGRKTTALGIP
jgi:DNA invertase Pin-like site-specific DNA recombinase